MQFIDDFIARKHGLKKITYLHPGMENSLKSTYGILVYQEQFMQISKEWCGFTGGQADTLRKAVGKKKIDLMRKVKVDFVAGAIKHGGASKEIAEQFWDQLEEFANYCFNKSHAACYALIAYWTAYLKAHYPAAFMAAVMTSDYDDTDRLAIEITECKHMGIPVLPPDINESFHEFAVVPDPADPDNRKAPVRFGMNAIKNVGTGAVEEIIRARSEEGAFKSLEDYLSKVNPRIVNRKNVESLIKAGAFDRFGDRSDLLHNMDMMLAYANRLQKEANSGQTDLFGNLVGEAASAQPKLALEKAAEVFSARDQLLWERELLGLYLSQHPLAMYETFLTEQTMPIIELKPEHEGRGVVVGGAISDVREITTRNGQKMAFIKLEDRNAEIELILFPGSYQQTVGLWERDRVVIARGKISAKDRDGNLGQDVKILVDDARELTSEQAQAYQPIGKKMRGPGSKRSAAASVTATKDRTVIQEAKQKAAQTEADVNAKPLERVYLRLVDSHNQDLLLSLKKVIDKTPGSTDVVLVLGPAENKQIIKLPTGVAKTQPLVDLLCGLLGKENVKVQ
jgi:DNA polymerase-3 subunit alpha